MRAYSCTAHGMCYCMHSMEHGAQHDLEHALQCHGSRAAKKTSYLMTTPTYVLLYPSQFATATRLRSCTVGNSVVTSYLLLEPLQAHRILAPTHWYCRAIINTCDSALTGTLVITGYFPTSNANTSLLCFDGCRYPHCDLQRFYMNRLVWP